MSSCVKMICDVGCHGGNNMYWCEGIANYSYGDVYCLYDVTWYGLCRSHGDCDCNICGDRTATLISCVCLCPGDSGEKSIWCSAWYGILVCDDVPEGGIQCRQSTTICPYSSHSKQPTFEQWHAIWPDSRHWKQRSSSWDMTFTVDDGIRVAVSCCVA